MKASTYNYFQKLSNGRYVLLNSLSGAIDVVGHEIIDMLKTVEYIDNVPQETIDFFYSRGYVFNNEMEEEVVLYKVRGLTEKISQKSQLGYSFTVCPTLMCNFRCSYCFEPLNNRIGTKVLNNEEVDKLFDAISKILSNGAATDPSFSLKRHALTLFGGEPLLPGTKSIVERIIKQSVENHNFSIDCVTNGYYLEKFIDIFTLYKDNISFLQITLDGTEAIHNISRKSLNGKGTFRKITNNINLALSKGLRVGVRTNVSRKNLLDLINLAEYIEEQRWNDTGLFVWQLSTVEYHYGDYDDDFISDDELMKWVRENFGNIDEFEKKYNAQFGANPNLRISRIKNAIDSTYTYRDVLDKKCNRSVGGAPIFKHCSARAGKYYVFGADGYIYACNEAVGNTDMVIGSYLPNYFIDEKKINYWMQDITNSEECRKCNVALFCGGACAYNNILQKGSITKPVCKDCHATIHEYIKSIEHKLITSN